MSSSAVLVALLAVSTLRACDPGSPSTGSDPDPVAVVPEVSQSCDRLTGDPVDVDYAFVEDDTLVVGVGYSGGCVDEHDFDVCWGGDWIKTLPMKVGLDLVHDAKGDSCRMYIIEELAFDLSVVKDETEAGFPGQEGVYLLLADESLWYAF